MLLKEAQHLNHALSQPGVMSVSLLYAQVCTYNRHIVQLKLTYLNVL